MDALLTAVGSVFTSAIGWVGTTASTIAAQPILLLAWAQVGWILCSIVLLGVCRSHKDTRASLRASAPSAICRTTSSLTAPWRSRVSGLTPSSSRLEASE